MVKCSFTDEVVLGSSPVEVTYLGYYMELHQIITIFTIVWIVFTRSEQTENLVTSKCFQES